MSMIVMQTAIARLCVDAEFRRAFLNDADRAVEGLDLTVEEVESIKALDMVAIREYAGSLVAKRAGLIRKWFSVTIPFLERTLGAHRMSHILRAYGIDEVRDGEGLGGEWVRAEFERFREYLRGLISSKKIEIEGFGDLLEIESLKFLMAQDPEVSASATRFSEANAKKEVEFTEEFLKSYRPVLGLHARLHSFEFNVAEFIEQIEEGEENAALEPERIEVLLFKKARGMTVDTSIINPPLKRLLEMCNGEPTIERVLSRIVREYAGSEEAGESGERELEEDCLAILAQLYEAGAITFVN